MEAAVSEALHDKVLLGKDVPGDIFLPLLNDTQSSSLQVRETRLRKKSGLALEAEAARRDRMDGASAVTVSPQTDFLTAPGLPDAPVGVDRSTESLNPTLGESVQITEGRDELELPPVLSSDVHNSIRELTWSDQSLSKMRA